jgi:hypothetical protein
LKSKIEEELAFPKTPTKQMQRRLSIPSIPGDHFAPVDLASEPISVNKEGHLTLGILGTSTAYNEVHIQQLTQTITQLWGMPTKILLQQSGQAAMFIESWADDNSIPIIPIQAEWSKYGPKACMYVNNKIEKEATHIVIIRSPRAKSDRMLQKAEQLSSKKNKPCLVLMDIEEDGSVVIDQYEVPEKRALSAPLKPLSKSNSNGMQDIRNMFLATTSPKI